MTPVRPSDRGYIMVVLLVGMGVAAIWMAAALPAWRQQVQRQKEEDLIFIGEQYAQAIVRYMMKNRNTYPQTIDILVSQRFLRKAWKDPITGEDFALVGPGMPQTPAAGTGGRNAGSALIVPVTGGSQGQNQIVGISGVRSKSQATSIKIYKNLQQHSLWPFDAAQMFGKLGYTAGRGGAPGQGGPGRGGPGDGRGGPGDGRGGPIGPGGSGRDGRGGATGPTGPTGPGRGRGGV